MSNERIDKQAMIEEIKEQVEKLLATESISEADKEQLIRQALKIIENGTKGVAQ